MCLFLIFILLSLLHTFHIQSPSLHTFAPSEGYLNWTRNGWKHWGDNGSIMEAENRNLYVDMVMDVLGDSMNVDDEVWEEEPNSSASKFFQLLKNVDETL